MVETGTVVQRLSPSRVKVQVLRGAACDTCHAKGACAPLSKGSSIIHFEAKDPFNCSPGDLVTISIGDGAILRAALWVYVFPLLLAIGAGVGTWYGLESWGQARDLAAAFMS